MNNQKTLAELQKSPVPNNDQRNQVSMSFFNMEGFELMQRIAKAFSSSDLVPKQYQGNLPNCMIALDMAQRIGANPLQVMQNLYVVHGAPGWSSKFLIATVNTCGRYSTMRYEWKGSPGEKGYGCRAWAVERETNERLDGVWVTWEMVNAEGWASKSGSKWKTMADQMFIYRAAAFWQRAYAPELGMGLQTVEEMQDVYDARKEPGGTFSVELGEIRKRDNQNPSVPADDDLPEVWQEILSEDKPLDEKPAVEDTAPTNRSIDNQEQNAGEEISELFGNME